MPRRWDGAKAPKEDRLRGTCRRRPDHRGVFEALRVFQIRADRRALKDQLGHLARSTLPSRFTAGVPSHKLRPLPSRSRRPIEMRALRPL